MATRVQVATDDFNRASLGANWTNTSTESSIVIQASTMFAADLFSMNIETVAGTAFWAGAGSFTDDQYAKATIHDLQNQGLGTGSGVVVRCSADSFPNQDFYYALVNADGNNGATHTVTVGKMVNGTNTSLGTRSITYTAGDTIELEVEGTTLRVYQNGVQLGADFSDSSITTGKPGILSLVNNGAGNYGDNWEGGNLSGLVNVSPVPEGVVASATVGEPIGFGAPPPPFTLARVTG